MALIAARCDRGVQSFENRFLDQETEKSDLAPKIGTLCWTSTHEDEERFEVVVAARGLVQVHIRGEIDDFGMCVQGRNTLDAIEERTESINKAHWRDILDHRSKMCRGESSAEDWRTMCVPSSLLAVKIGPGPFRQWTESKGGRVK